MKRGFKHVLMFAMALVFVSLTVPAQSPVHAKPDKLPQYYVSLGDSLAAGYQPDKKTGDGHVSDDAYTDQIYQRIKGHIKNLEHEKLGCPGETSAGLIGDAPSFCTAYYEEKYGESNQLDAAVAFLTDEANADKIAFITINIGANDISQCGTDPYCVANALNPELTTSIPQNLNTALAALQAAAPGVPIIGLNYYNPNLYYWLVPYHNGMEGWQWAELTNDIVLGLDQALKATYGLDIPSVRVPVPVADITAAFDTEDFTLEGGVPHNVKVICRLTWMCDDVTEQPDIHPNKNGYKVIARTVEQLMKSLGLL
jgi:lysophospholipase L1-like esterase